MCFACLRGVYPNGTLPTALPGMVSESLSNVVSTSCRHQVINI